jgi:hypothetical protein
VATVKALFLAICFFLTTAVAAQELPDPNYWYPAKFRPQLFISGVVAGKQTTVKATLVEWNSPIPSRVVFVVGKYQEQLVQTFPFGVLHIKLPGAFIREYWLQLKFPARVMTFDLAKGYIPTALRGTKWCAQFYIEYYAWSVPAPITHPLSWLSYPRTFVIQ